jgi:hypothetical protein
MMLTMDPSTHLSSFMHALANRLHSTVYTHDDHYLHVHVHVRTYRI